MNPNKKQCEMFERSVFFFRTHSAGHCLNENYAVKYICKWEEG